MDIAALFGRRAETVWGDDSCGKAVSACRDFVDDEGEEGEVEYGFVVAFAWELIGPSIQVVVK